MAPEQQSGVVAPSVDLYAPAGVVLFEMLAGHLPPKEAPPMSDQGSTFHLDPRRAAPRRGIPSLSRPPARAPSSRIPRGAFRTRSLPFAQALRGAMAGLQSGEPVPSFARAAPAMPKRAMSATLPAPLSRDDAPLSGLIPTDRPRRPPAQHHEPPHRPRRRFHLGLRFPRSAEPPPAIAFWGRPGIGRTRLVREVAAVAESEGALVVTIGLPPHPSGEVGYVGLRHIVRGLCGLTPAQLMDERATGQVDRWALTGLRVLFSRAKAPSRSPRLRGARPRRRSAWRMGRATRRAGASEGLSSIDGESSDPYEHDDAMDSATASRSTAASGRPAPRAACSVLDDSDCLDGSSFLALRDHLQSTQGAGSSGLTVLVTSQHVRTLMLLAGVRERMLRGLSREDARRMSTALGGPEDLARQDDDIEPLYVAQVVATGATDGRSLPGSLEELIARRMQAVTVGQRRVLQALAVVGVHHVESLGVLLRHPGDMETALQSAVQAGFVERRGAHVMLRHSISAPSRALAPPRGRDRRY